MSPWIAASARRLLYPCSLLTHDRVTACFTEHAPDIAIQCLFMTGQPIPVPALHTAACNHYRGAHQRWCTLDQSR